MIQVHTICLYQHCHDWTQTLLATVPLRRQIQGGKKQRKEERKQAAAAAVAEEATLEEGGGATTTTSVVAAPAPSADVSSCIVDDDGEREIVRLERTLADGNVSESIIDGKYSGIDVS